MNTENKSRHRHDDPFNREVHFAIFECKTPKLTAKEFCEAAVDYALSTPKEMKSAFRPTEAELQGFTNKFPRTPFNFPLTDAEDACNEKIPVAELSNYLPQSIITEILSYPKPEEATTKSKWPRFACFPRFFPFFPR